MICASRDTIAAAAGFRPGRFIDSHLVLVRPSAGMISETKNTWRRHAHVTRHTTGAEKTSEPEDFATLLIQPSVPSQPIYEEYNTKIQQIKTILMRW